MSRKTFAIWFAIFIILQLPISNFFPQNNSIIEVLLLMIVLGIIRGNIMGLVYIILKFLHAFKDLDLYFSNPNWFHLRYHNYYQQGGTDTMIIWMEDMIPFLLSCIVILHLYISAKRCKDIGISAWWILVPLFNPLVLLFRKSSSVINDNIKE